MGLENYEVLPVEAQEVQIVQVDAVERANVDSQVATAKQYPRSIKRCVDNSIAMATMDSTERWEAYYRSIRSPRKNYCFQLGEHEDRG